MIGDSKDGKGSAKEVVAPLDDLKKELGGAGQTQVHVHVKGLISPDNLGKVVKTINRKVANRQLTLHASNSFRVTKRSQ